jgi:hypothetical protein
LSIEERQSCTAARRSRAGICSPKSSSGTIASALLGPDGAVDVCLKVEAQKEEEV